jgi:metal-responsive CopG/Arc/MetJ family transcriptional regulator
MSEKREDRKPYRVPGKTPITVYLPDDLLVELRQAMKDERRGLSDQVTVIIERYLKDKSPEEAQQVRDALVRQGYSTT